MKYIEELNHSVQLFTSTSLLRRRPLKRFLMGSLWLALTLLEAVLFFLALPKSTVGFVIFGVTLVLAMFLVNPILAYRVTLKTIKD